jgi:hypothetical protein
MDNLSKLTVADVINAQIRSANNLDTTKNCSTCRYEKETGICEKCFNSFMGIVFTPSEFKPVEKN